MAIESAIFLRYVDEKIEVKGKFANVGVVDSGIDSYGPSGLIRFLKKEVTKPSLIIFDEDHATVCFDEELRIGFRERRRVKASYLRCRAARTLIACRASGGCIASRLFA